MLFSLLSGEFQIKKFDTGYYFEIFQLIRAPESFFIDKYSKDKIDQMDQKKVLVLDPLSKDNKISSYIDYSLEHEVSEYTDNIEFEAYDPNQIPVNMMPIVKKLLLQDLFILQVV